MITTARGEVERHSKQNTFISCIQFVFEPWQAHNCQGAGPGRALPRRAVLLRPRANTDLSEHLYVFCGNSNLCRTPSCAPPAERWHRCRPSELQRLATLLITV